MSEEVHPDLFPNCRIRQSLKAITTEPQGSLRAALPKIRSRKSGVRVDFRLDQFPRDGIAEGVLQAGIG
jgi:hypothetical protein